ncbi:hypothetical protein CRI93_14210 [Longimonas halophila]|uniref:6-bladed beta-propeller n=1 Tax=Longimonas halophila TaxID=1469170 RepID=A0A2H3P1Y0_9BACT|nr:hypothetical protein [Longimonas halophila]PEN05009.1 hypothetical protein CRI93_14210 [Longimonas halophila]
MRIFRIISPLTLVFLFAITGCAESDSSDSQVADTPVSTLSLDPIWSTAEAGNDFLGDGPFMVRVDADSQVYVADRSTQQVHQFGSDGTWQATTGGSQGGPGALQFLVGLDLALDGRVLVVDGSQNQVLTWEEVSAAPRSTHRINPWQSYRPFGLFVTDACTWAIPHRMSHSAQTGADVDPREHVVRYRCDSEVPSDTLFSYPRPEQIVAEPMGGIATSAHPHGRKSVVRYHDEHFYEGHTSAPAFRVRRQDGTIIDRIRFDHTPVPIEQNKLDAMRADLENDSDTPPAVASALLDAIDNAPRYDTHPVFDHIAVDAADRLWVQPVDPNAEQATWLVVNRSGETVAQAHAASLAVRLDVVHRNRAYGIRQTDDGAHEVVAFAITEE